MADPRNHRVIRWLKDQKCWLQADDPRAPTHSFLNPCGKAHIPPALIDEFDEQYATTLVTDSRAPLLGVVEIHGHQFFMHMDLDFQVPDPASVLALQEELLCTVHAAVRRALPQADELVVCSPAQPRRLQSQLFKVGIHLHWPGVKVGTSEAMAARAACIAACQEAFADSHKWEDVFDKAVFRPHTGLRIIGSAKGPSRQPDRASVYLPRCVLRSAPQGPVQVERMACPWANLVSWLRKTRVACPSSPGDSPAPPAEPSYFSSGFDGVKSAVPLTAFQQADLVTCIKSCVTISDDLKAAPVAKVLVLAAPGAGAGGLPSVVLALNSKRCLNLRGRLCHSGNHTYLVANSHGVWQRCHCSKATLEGRRFGACKDFSCQVGRLSERLKAKLASLAVQCAR